MSAVAAWLDPVAAGAPAGESAGTGVRSQPVTANIARTAAAARSLVCIGSSASPPVAPGRRCRFLTVEAAVEGAESGDRQFGRADEDRRGDAFEIVRRAVVVRVIVHAEIQEGHLGAVKGGVVRGVDPVVLAGVLR